MTRKQWDELFLKVGTMPLDELKKIIVDSARKADVLQTNADKIRQMSDEELADAIYSAVDSCPEGKRPEGTCVANAYDCRTCWLSWLKAPVEEVQDG